MRQANWSEVQDSGASYFHAERAPGSHKYVSARILRLCAGLPGRRVIDIGCGNGSLCRDLAAAGFAVVGVEPSESGLRHARAQVPEAAFYALGVYDDPDEVVEKDFDMAVSTEVVEHLFKPTALVHFARRKLRVGGHFVISTPYHGWLKNSMIALAGAWDHHHQPAHDGGHIKFWSRRTLSALLESGGFDVVDFVGVGRVAWLWKSMILVARKRAE